MTRVLPLRPDPWLATLAAATALAGAAARLPLALTAASTAALWITAAWRRDRGDPLSFFFRESPLGKSLTTPDGRLLRVNRAFCAMLGYSAEEMQRISWPDVTHPDDLAQSREAQRALIAGEADKWEMEKRYRRRDGTRIWTHVTIGVHRHRAGRVRYFLTHVQDITGRRHAAEQLQDRERALTQAQAIAHVGSWEWDMVSNAVTWSDELRHIFGIRLDAPAGYAEFLALAHPDDRSRLERIVAEAARTHRSADYEWRVVRPDGEVRHILARNVVVEDDSGAAVRMAGTSWDITDRKRAEEQVKVLTGILPICAQCKRIHTESGTWEAVESYVRARSDAEFSHGLCPQCAQATWGGVTAPG